MRIHCQLSALIGAFFSKIDMEAYRKTLPPPRKGYFYEQVGDKRRCFDCGNVGKECEYYNGGCILKSCIHKTMESVEIFAEFLIKQNICAPEKVNEAVQDYLPIALQQAGLDEHYQIHYDKIIRNAMDELKQAIEFEKRARGIRK